jgi:release factor glutamine methyltransferase
MADIIVSNPPYVRSGDLPTLQPEVRDFEPELALIAGPEGTEIQQRIIVTAPEFLKKYGALIMEMGQGQSGALMRMVNDTGRYDVPKIMKDLAGIERVIVARKNEIVQIRICKLNPGPDRPEQNGPWNGQGVKVF